MEVARTQWMDGFTRRETTGKLEQTDLMMTVWNLRMLNLGDSGTT